MARKIQITKAAIDANDPRLSIVIAAGALRAEEAFFNDGWRRAPAQCPIYMSTAKGATTAEMFALLDGWNGAYMARVLELQAAA